MQNTITRRTTLAASVTLPLLPATAYAAPAGSYRRSLLGLAPRRGKQARNTSRATAQSAPVIFVDIADPPISRLPMNHVNLTL